MGELIAGRGNCTYPQGFRGQWIILERFESNVALSSVEKSVRTRKYEYKNMKTKIENPKACNMPKQLAVNLKRI